MQGWIKLHRKLLDNPIFTKEGLLQLFIYCLLKANHEEARIIFNNKEEIIGVGQFITGREVLSKDLNVKESTIYKRLKNLEKLGILNIKSNNKFSLVTIVNYTMYQIEESESNSKSNNKVTTKEQQSNTNKNDKNDKNEKKNIYAEYVYLKESEYKKLIDEHGEMLVKKFIETLNNYKGANGKKYKSDYLAILNWVVDKVKKNEPHKQEVKAANRNIVVADEKWAREMGYIS